MDETIEELKRLMAERDWTLSDVAKRINRSPKTVWQFIHQRVKPHDRTLYKIKMLIGKQQ